MNQGDFVGNRYRLTRRLGSGAMGAVWEAINEKTGRKVALKLILHPTDELRQRLLCEAKACGKLKHPNIVEVYDVGATSAGDPFLVMELLSGQTLAELLQKRRRLSTSLAARFGRDVASALSAAHAAKIIHRDLKPANIFLHHEAGADEPKVKVLDFGVSKNLASPEVHATVTGQLIGSPAYMSPEQVGMAKDIDHRTDLWTFGVVLYEMLTGVRPFQGATVEEVITQICVSPVPLVSSQIRQIPLELDEIVARCLERDRGQRVPTAADLVALLSPLVENGRWSSVEIHVPPSSPSSSDEREAPKPQSAEAGTRHLPPSAPVASPTPVWQHEVRRFLAEKRRDAQTLGGEAPAMEPEHLAAGPAEPFVIGDAASSAPPATTCVEFDATSAPRASRTWLHGTIAAGIFATTALATLIVMYAADASEIAPTLAQSVSVEVAPPVTASVSASAAYKNGLLRPRVEDKPARKKY